MYSPAVWQLILLWGFYSEKHSYSYIYQVSHCYSERLCKVLTLASESQVFYINHAIVILGLTIHRIHVTSGWRGTESWLCDALVPAGCKDNATTNHFSNSSVINWACLVLRRRLIRACKLHTQHIYNLLESPIRFSAHLRWEIRVWSMAEYWSAG